MTAAAPSRDMILDAAELLFATRGFAATTIKQIAAAANVNSALLYYYFQNKATLYREMLRRVFSSMAGQGMAHLDHPETPTHGIRAMVRFQSGFLNARPHLPKLILREFADPDATQAMPMVTEFITSIFQRLCEIIREGQRRGDFRRDLDPAFAAISIVSQVAYLHIARPAVTRLLGHDGDTPPASVATAFAEHAAEFALAALRVPETPDPLSPGRGQ